LTGAFFLDPLTRAISAHSRRSPPSNLATLT
jgi:hypothetical protein